MRAATVSVCILFLVSAAYAHTNFDDPVVIEPVVIYIMCAAVNAMLAGEMDEGIAADKIWAEAQRHFTLAKRLGATDADLKQYLEATALAYNSGRMTWDKIADLGEMCTSH